MKFRSLLSAGAAAAAAVLALSLAGPAAAELPSRPALECFRQCVGLRATCVRACNASFLDCMRAAKLETRMCAAECREQFAEDTPELESCVAACRDEILVPARDECLPLRSECAPQCLPPRPCLELCGPDGGGIGEWDECRGACAHELRRCVGEVRAELRECLSPCRELTDEAERQACAAPCLEAARAGAVVCKENFVTCASACDEPTTTTTLTGP